MSHLLLDMPWGRMACDIRGTGGPALLFLHGTGCDNDDWTGVLEHVPNRFRVICPKFRGHGRSDASSCDFTCDSLADDICRLLEHLDLHDVRLIGHSLGGMVGMRVAPRSPRVTSIVLLEGWTHMRSAAEAFPPDRFFGTLSKDAIRRIDRKSETAVARAGHERWSRFRESCRRFDGTDFLRTTALPVREVYGSLGRHAGTVRLLGVPERPNISWTWIEGAGHYLPHEKPEETAKACLDGLAP